MKNHQFLIGNTMFSSIRPSNSLGSIMGPLKSFLRWLSARLGPQPKRMPYFWNYRDARTLLGVARWSQDRRTPSRTFDLNLDCVFVQERSLPCDVTVAYGKRGRFVTSRPFCFPSVGTSVVQPVIRRVGFKTHSIINCIIITARGQKVKIQQKMKIWKCFLSFTF